MAAEHDPKWHRALFPFGDHGRRRFVRFCPVLADNAHEGRPKRVVQRGVRVVQAACQFGGLLGRSPCFFVFSKKSERDGEVTKRANALIMTERMSSAVVLLTVVQADGTC